MRSVLDGHPQCREDGAGGEFRLWEGKGSPGRAGMRRVPALGTGKLDREQE